MTCFKSLILRNLALGALVCSVSFTALQAKATAIVDFGGTFSSDSLKVSSETTRSQNFYNLSVMFNLDSKMSWNIGWAVFGISDTSGAGTSTTTYSSFDMGPAFRWNIDKNGMFSLTLIYGYLAKGKYSVGTTNEDWEGSSLLLQAGMQAPIRDDKFYIGVTLNSYSGTYTEKTVNNVKSPVSSTKSSFFPMVTMTFRM